MAPYEIWLFKQFLRRRCSKSVDDGACLYYKLTHEPKGSDELKCGKPGVDIDKHNICLFLIFLLIVEKYPIFMPI